MQTNKTFLIEVSLNFINMSLNDNLIRDSEQLLVYHKNNRVEIFPHAHMNILDHSMEQNCSCCLKLFFKKKKKKV